MGFHIILGTTKKGVEHRYAEDMRDLIMIDGLSNDTVIYQADEQWIPKRLDMIEELSGLLEPKLIAGLRAEFVFEKICKNADFILEKISQDKVTFQQFYQNQENKLKRGDYIVRDALNTEVDVKCLSKYNYQDEDYFYLPYSHIKCHENMSNITRSEVIFAIFERDGSNPITDSLNMIPVSNILNETNNLVTYDNSTKCLRIPVSLMETGITYLINVRENKHISHEN